LYKLKFNVPFPSRQDPQMTAFWCGLADELEAEFIEPRDLMMGGAHLDGGLHLPVALWKVTLCAHTTFMKGTDSRMTRAHVCYASQLPFAFSITRRGFFLDALKMLHIVRDIEVGDPVFDQAFILTGNNEEAFRGLLADEPLRQAILFHPPVTVVNHCAGAMTTLGSLNLPPNVNVLSLEAPEVIPDPERLKQMLQLLTATLERLAVIGVALRQPAGVEIRGPLGLTPPTPSG
jgi:hypothetical protein